MKETDFQRDLDRIDSDVLDVSERVDELEERVDYIADAIECLRERAEKKDATGKGDGWKEFGAFLWGLAVGALLVLSGVGFWLDR
ncbi:MAG: hypothetical protein IJM30_10090 [Thermoguttaceae bacterium]|nr:hypothetical protein [Thermoguttaceae bacterium]